MIFLRSLVLMWLLTGYAPAIAQSVQCRDGLEAADRKDYISTVKNLTQCLELPLPDGLRSFVLQVRAHSYMELKAPGKALDDQKKSLALQDPKDVWPLVMLAAYYRELKRYDEALSALKSAQRFDEDGPGTGPGMAVFYHTGLTLHQAGRYAEAIEAFTKGIPKQPDYGYALYHRALSYEAIGNRKQAKRDLFRVFELTPKDGYDSEIVAKLKEYGLLPHMKSK